MVPLALGCKIGSNNFGYKAETLVQGDVNAAYSWLKVVSTRQILRNSCH